MNAGTVSARFVSRLVEIGVSARIPRQLLLEVSGLTDLDLCDGDRRLPIAAEISLWQTLGQHGSDPGIGVRMGAGIQLLRTGLFGYVVGYSVTLGDALRRVQRYGRVFSDASHWQLSEASGTASFTLHHPTLGEGLALAQDYRLAAVVRGSREMTGVDIVPVEVTFTHPPPASTLIHREFFRCPMRFNAPSARIVFRVTDLRLPVSRGDANLSLYLSQRAEAELSSLGHAETLTRGVQAAIWELLERGRPSVGSVARRLGLPVRTVQRRLAAERTTFQREVEAIRRAAAMASLRDGSVAIADVALRLGYSEPSTFYRSFKRWTGQTPDAFRRRAA